MFLPRQQLKLARGTHDKEHAMSQTTQSAVAVIGIDIGKNSFHIVGHDERAAIVLRQKWSRGQVETRLSNIDPVHPPVDAELSLLAEAQRTLTCALSGGACAIERARPARSARTHCVTRPRHGSCRLV